MTLSNIFMISGFLLAAYSIVANDAIQTLGTFLCSNGKRKWWVLFLYAGGILTLVSVGGWWLNDGDMSWGRLDRFPVPEQYTWIHVIPPLTIMILTYFGVPVSTTFLILTVFSSAHLGDMVIKSMAGYVVAFFFALLVNLFITRNAEKYFYRTSGETPSYWVVLQWCSTGFLWAMWLMQDMANIFIYIPTRSLSLPVMLASVAVLLIFHAILFYIRGGAIQKIVTCKTNTVDIRSATLIDFMFGIVLLVFKEASNMPMSTTWVFIGILAGREIGLTHNMGLRPMVETIKLTARDIIKVFTGLAVSVLLAYLLPFLFDLIGPIQEL